MERRLSGRDLSAPWTCWQASGVRWYAASILPSCPSVRAEGVYWTDRGTSQIWRKVFNRGGVITVLDSGVLDSSGTILRGIAVDGANLRLYWADNGPDTVRRSHLDGGESVLLAEAPGGSSFPKDV